MNTKQVIVMRADLMMPIGKAVAQGSHASIAFLTKRLKPYFDPNKARPAIALSSEPYELDLKEQEIDWLENSFTKVCVAVDSEKELLEIEAVARSMGLECHLITDDGRTCFNNIPTKTCLAIGPDECEKIDIITKHLRLYR